MSKKHQIRAYGLEIDQEKIAIAISRGLNIIQQDLKLGLHRFADQSFDYVVMAQALQAVDAPDVLLRDMVRVGKQAIITFPNFAHWKTRSFLALKGMMPCLKHCVLKNHCKWESTLSKHIPNLFGEVAIYRVSAL
jgi:methionine biosynthesis protein MetW